MELLFLLFLFFLKSSHIKGFSHCEQEGWNSLFIVADQDELDIIVDGYPTGLQAPCKIFVDPSKASVFIELKRSGHSLYSKQVDIIEKDSFIVSQVSPSLHLFA